MQTYNNKDGLNGWFWIEYRLSMAKYFLVASALRADETGLVTRLRTLSMNNRRENLIKLFSLLAAFARFT
jgi:hypothetical protein